MTIDADGILYITANSGGEIIRLDPVSKQACPIATGLQTPSAVKFGAGPGWPANRLYVVGFDGRLRELIPPPPPPFASLPTSTESPARLRVAVAPKRLRAGRRSCLRVRVSAKGRPVRRAIVLVARRRAMTDARGLARLCVRLRRGLHRVTVARSGYAPVRVRVRAR